MANSSVSLCAFVGHSSDPAEPPVGWTRMPGGVVGEEPL